jgi:hypothetical protein
VVDAKTKKPVADAVVFLKAPKNTYFPIHDDDKKRNDLVVQIPSGGMFKSRMMVHYPYYFDGAKEMPTGQKFVLKGDSQQDHAMHFFCKQGIHRQIHQSGKRG